MTTNHYCADDLTAMPGIAHGFFGRSGGVSTGDFASLNISDTVGDDPADTFENRRRAAAALGFGIEKLSVLKQVHSAHVLTITKPIAFTGRPDGDALVTNVKGLLLGTLSADCAPILCADPVAGVIAAAHAGWKGAVNGIAEATISAMEALGAERCNMVAVVGPTISATNYEVGPQFAAELLARHPGAAYAISTPQGGREHFDLPGFLVGQLRAFGLGKVIDSGICTYADENRYFSHRRATHQNGRTGRQIAMIGLR